MSKEIIPMEKYVEKALIEQIFSSTVGSHSQFHQETPRYFKILQKNLMDSITIKQPKEEEKNKQNINRNLQIKLTKNYDNWNKILKYRHNSYNRRGLTKRSYSSKYSNVFRYIKNNREVLSTFGFRTINKDFSDITSNINYLLERNQTLLTKEKNFIDGFDFFHKNKLNTNIFKRKLYSSRNGMFGKKEEVPLVYGLSLTHKNIYSSKSEKSRHEYILNELNKLKFYFERHPYKKVLIIKDFFLKFNIKDLDKYSDEKLLNICNIISSSDQNELLNIIKPDKNIKAMIYNILNIPSLIEKNKKNYRKLNLTKLGNSNKNFYGRSRNNMIHNENIFGVFDTNSKLKYIENQKNLLKPERDYSQNVDLIIKDIGKEIIDIKNNISHRKDKIGEQNNIFFITQSKNKTISYNNLGKKKSALSYFNINKYKPTNNKGTFLFFRKSLTKNKENIINIKDIKKLNLCLTKKKSSVNYEVKDRLIEDKQIKLKKKANTKDIVNRLYYKYHLKTLGLNEVKRTKKLTEFIALNLAKKKSRIKNFENILNPIRKNHSYNLERI